MIRAASALAKLYYIAKTPTANWGCPMNGTTETSGNRILTLDVTRGVAVMGIFSVNVVAMAMIQIAYFYPPAFGFDHLSDKLMWLTNFILVDGKLRSLFSMMFGASTLLIVDRAIASARSPWKTHYARMIVLMGFGMSPRLDTLFGGWVGWFGGRQSVRSIHFIIAWVLVAFVLVHVFEVIVTGFWNNVRSMITGRYRVPEARVEGAGSSTRAAGGGRSA